MSMPVRVLLSFRDQPTKMVVRGIIESGYPKQVSFKEFEVLQDAIELLEKGGTDFNVIIFEHNSPSVTIIKMLLELQKGAAFIMCSKESSTHEAVKAIPNAPECILSADVDTALPKVFTKLSTLAKVPPMAVLNQEQYMPMSPEAILKVNPIRYDVFVKFGKEGRFVCLFKKGTELSRADLDKYNKKQGDFFFVRKADGDEIMKEQASKLEAMANQKEVPIGEAGKQFSNSIETVRDLVSQSGFTPEAQAVAKASVMMSLKALGAKPKLSSIITELKKKEGDYLVSHSFMVGQVACALAHKLGWNSAATFFKLSLAGFLHDISLNSEILAQIDSLTAAKASGNFEDAELNLVKFHTVKSSDYSKQFTEIPSDVDQIISQHHERPDGTGFPRAMAGKLISPLSALFIMAHDLVHAVHENPETDTETYFDDHAEEYQVGQFKKILTGLKSGTPAAQ